MDGVNIYRVLKRNFYFLRGEMNELISIIIAVKNEEKTIQKCIDSLLSLSYPNYEIIVVDNNSDDKTLELLKQYKEKIKILENKTPGPSACRNMAIKIAKGEYIAFTDGDCVVSSNWLAELMLGFQDEKVVSVGGSQAIPEDESDFGVMISRFLSSVGFITDYVKTNNQNIKNVEHNPSCNVIYKRFIFDEIGFFDENLWPGEDVLLDYKIRKQGYSIFYNPNAIVYHYRQQNTLTDFMRMMIRYGEVQGILVKQHGLFRKIHYLPILTLFFLLIMSTDFFLGVSLLYEFILIGFIYYFIKEKKIINTSILTLLATTAFISWNTGFVQGIFKKK